MIRWIYILVLISSTAFFLIRPALALKLRTELLSSAVEVTALTSSFMLARALSSTLGSVAGDMNPDIRKKIMLFSLFPISLIVLLYSLINNVVYIILLNFVHGFFAGLLWPNIQTQVGFLSNEKSRYIGIYFAFAGIGSSIGYFLYSILPLSNNDFIALGSALYFISFLIAFFTFKKIRVKKMNKKIKIRSVFSRRTSWILSIAFLTGCIVGILHSYIYIFLYEFHGLKKEELGIALTISALASIMSNAVSGYLADRYGLIKVISLFVFVASLSLLMLAVLKGFFAVMFSLTLAVVSVKAIMPLTRSIKITENREVTGTAIGLSNTLSNIGSFAYPLISGYLYDLGYETLPLLVVAVLMLIFLIPQLIVNIRVYICKYHR